MLALASQVVHHLMTTKLFAVVRYFVPGLCVLMLFESYALANTDTSPIPNIDVVAGPSMLVGGVFAVGALILKRRYEWFHKRMGTVLLPLAVAVFTSCSEMIFRKGLSLNVLYAATGSALLTFAVTANNKPVKNETKKDGQS